VLTAALLFTACGGQQPNQSSGQPNQSEKGNGQKAESVIIKLGHGQPVESSAHKSLEKFAEEVKTNTNGAVEVQIFPANQLGNERDLAEGLTMGTIDMAWISAGVMENFETKFAVFSLPYVFRDYEHVHQIAEGELGKVIFDSLLQGKNIRTLAFYDQGFRFIWNNIKPIEKLEDLKGMKIRAPESPVYVGTFNFLGSNPTPIPWGEVYTSMQTKVVDGFEVFPESVVTNNLNEVTKYGSKSRHIYAGSVLMINEDVYKKLSAEQQDIIHKAAANSEKYNRDLIVESEEKYVKDLEGKGMKINDISEEEIQKFRDAVKPLYKDYADKVGGLDFIEKIIATGK